MDEQQNLEVYIRTASTPKILRWLADALGPVHRVDPDLHLYRVATAPREVSILVQPEIGDGHFTGVYLAPNATPWPTDVTFARAAFRALGQEVRCDPGTLSGRAWHWFRIDRSGEALVEWGDAGEV